MNDIRDQFPMPPCANCGRGMCVKDGQDEGYRCTTCGAWFEMERTHKSMTDPQAKALRSLVMNLRLTMGHWRMAMEHAFETFQYDKITELIEGHKKWLDEVGLPMADCVRKIKHGEQTEPLPETTSMDWLDKMP